MAQANGNGYERSNHEDRIQRLEESNTNLSVQVGVVGIKVTDMSNSLSTKLDELGERIECTNKKMDNAADAIDLLGDKVTKLEEVHSLEKARWSGAKKWLMAAIAGGAGIIATKLVELYLGK